MPSLLRRIAPVMVVMPFGLIGCSSNETVSDETLAYEEPRFDPNEVICKRQRPVGSHVPVRVCRTRLQMERDREAAYRNFGPGAPEMGDLPPPPPPTPSPP
jgi:hypothetical protein